MTGEKIKQVVATYREQILKEAYPVRLPIAPKRCDVVKGFRDIGAVDRGSHLLYMCDEIVKFVDEGRIEKAMRWYGFLQGFFWRNNNFTIEELGQHSMPDPEKMAEAPQVRTCTCNHPFNQHAGSPAIGKCLEEGCCCLLSIEQLLAGEGQ